MPVLKKSTILLCSCSTASLLPPAHSCITSSCKPCTRRPRSREPLAFSTQPRRNTPSSLRHLLLSRSYATVSDDRPSRPSDPAHHGWPSSRNPTPYEVFGQERHAPYSKAKFYELVKIYHPDRHRLNSGPLLSHSARLERYRLVVAANEILSDPVKRRAYDLYKAGWGDRRSMESSYRAADKAWREAPGNASMNATWEDWERWYDERNGENKKQQPVYMSNELFVGVLCAFVVIGSMGQARRASNNSMNLVEMSDQKHEAISQKMRQRHHEQAPLNRHERVENFLRQRDGWQLASSMSSQSASSVSEGK
ncbi:hypothetical protein F5X99DRAFT_343877 [Biscogniauxia marginata]|nr:hypothetical protein F5X99DRAFT_343877 [Biscogniauxia marginata]